ncbi:MAG: hypothetical protein KGJ23_04850 [Euryarchaeota archaeon]|nr:hypothetical protein [Euryarchaeota archaeon]MDE1835927.1 hypothetical protein [Euryarchaeota archaeon]MDE1880599.1 hypothetical protein [Euryarchaeota archaeon]MDE2044395.1 hypothetical protein [Thermoplasmata archaeon]
MDEPQKGRREFALSPPLISLRLTAPAREALTDLLRIRPRGSVVHLTMVPGDPPHPHLALRPATRGEVVFEVEGLPFVVDPESQAAFAGATIDHVVEDGFAAFQVEGPHLPQAERGLGK